MQFNEISAGESHLLLSIGLPAVSQVGIIVNDLDKAVRYYRSLLNIKRWYSTRINGEECYYRGKPIDQRLDIAVGYWGKTQVELIRQHCGEENVYNAALGIGGQGFHHLGVTVADLEKKVSLFQKGGIEALQTGTIRFGRGGVTKYAYLDTLERTGFILELIETRAFGINLGMPQWVVNLGRITGDTESI